MANVLALDLSGRATGACYGAGGTIPHCVTLFQELDGDDYGPVGSALSAFMVGLIRTYKISHVAFESPWVPMGARGNRERSGMTPVRIIRLGCGMAFLAETVATDQGCTRSEVEPSVWRKHFLGTGRPEDPKQAVMERCRLLGWPAKNHNEGDAAGIWAYTQALIDPRFAYATTALFGRRR